MERGKGDKRGLSTIIVTVILVGLSLAAIVIVWTVVGNLLNKGADNINLQSTCSGITVDVLSMNCSLGVSAPLNCSVVLERTGTDQSVISGVSLVFKNASLSSSPRIDVSGDVPKLVGKVVNVNTTISSSNSVGVTVYINDKTNVPQFCEQTSTFP